MPTVPSHVPTPPSLDDRLAEAVAGRLLGVASDDTLAWERCVTAHDVGAARLARRYEERVRWLMDHAGDPVEQFERLTGRRLSP